MPARTSWIPYALIAPSVALSRRRCSSCRWCRPSGCRSRPATACRSTTTARMAGDLNFVARRSATRSCSPSWSCRSRSRSRSPWRTMLQKLDKGRDLVLWVLDHPARRLRSRSRPCLARDPAEHRLSQLRALRARRHPRPGRLALAGDAGRAVRRHRARRGLARDRDRAGDPGRRPAADPEGIRRGRRDLRRAARGRASAGSPCRF